MKINKNTEVFIKGTISISIAVVLTKIMGVLYKVPLSYILGDEGMGYFNSAYAIYSFLYILCTSGVPKAITLSLADNTDREACDSYSMIKSGISLFMKIGIIVTVLTVILAPALVNILGSKKSIYTIIAIAPSIIFVSMSGVLRGCMNYYNKLSNLALSQLLEAIIKLALGLAFAYLGVRMKLPLYIISALCVLGITLGSIISCGYLYMSYKKLFYREKSGQRIDNAKNKLRKSIYKIALPISFGAALLNIGSVIDLGIIMNQLTSMGMSDVEANSIYGNYTTLAVPMVNLVISVISPIMMAFLPKLATAYNNNEKETFSLTFKKMLIINSSISIPAAFAFYFYSFDLLDILFSVHSAAIGAELLVCLSLGLIFVSYLTVVNTALEAKGKVKLTVLSLLVGTVVKAIGNYVFIERFGIIGAPMSTVISYAVSLLISVIALQNFGSDVKVLRVLIPDVLMAVLCFFPVYTYMYSRGGIFNGFFGSVVCIALSCILYFSLFILRLYICDSKQKC